MACKKPDTEGPVNFWTLLHVLLLLAIEYWWVVLMLFVFGGPLLAFVLAAFIDGIFDTHIMQNLRSMQGAK